MKLCIDCEHYDNSGFGFYCKHPESVIRTDVVTGRMFYKTCDEMRNNGLYGPCGVEGKLFKPKIFKPKIPLKDKVIQAIKDKLGR